MVRHNIGALFRELERDVRNERPIAPTLRKLILFGGQVGSPKLREWGRSELTGYAAGDEIPLYRRVPAIIQMDGATQFSVVKGQRVGVFDLPDFAQGDINEMCTFNGPIAEIEAMSIHRDSNGESVKISLPMARELGRMMAQGASNPVHIDSIYWSVSRIALAQLVDQVRTRLAELLSELRAVTPKGQNYPTPQATETVAGVVLKGFSRATFNTINSGDGSENRIEIPMPDPFTFWTLGRRIAAVVSGVIVTVAAVIAIIEFVY